MTRTPCHLQKTRAERGSSISTASSWTSVRRIGDCPLYGPAVQIYTPLHPFNAEERRGEEFGRPVDIGSDVCGGSQLYHNRGAHFTGLRLINAALTHRPELPMTRSSRA
jgi:hypothetical protein